MPSATFVGEIIDGHGISQSMKKPVYHEGRCDKSIFLMKMMMMMMMMPLPPRWRRIQFSIVD